MPQDPDWFVIALPTHLTWGAHPAFWRAVLVEDCRKSTPAAFTGRNLLRPFQALHTQHGVVLDQIMMLVDVPRERVIIAAFPSFIGPTVGNSTRSLSDMPHLGLSDGTSEAIDEPIPDIGQQIRYLASSTESEILAGFGLRMLSIKAEDGSPWRIVLQEFDASPSEVLSSDGDSLTQLGAAKVENVVRGAVTAAASWLPNTHTGTSAPVQVQVKVEHQIASPRLHEPLTQRPHPKSAVGSHPIQSRTQVEIHGSSQSGFATNPIVRAFWNGDFVGELKSIGGRFVFDIQSAGTLRLKSRFRTASVDIVSAGSVIYLGWDRTWGRLIADRNPYPGK